MKRKKKIDVGVDESVLINAEKIVNKIYGYECEGDNCSVNRSEVSRWAMDIGLRAKRKDRWENEKQGACCRNC